MISGSCTGFSGSGSVTSVDYPAGFTVFYNACWILTSNMQWVRQSDFLLSISPTSMFISTIWIQVHLDFSDLCLDVEDELYIYDGENTEGNLLDVITGCSHSNYIFNSMTTISLYIRVRGGGTMGTDHRFSAAFSSQGKTRV